MALWFPVVMFVLPGFEHAVANSKQRKLKPLTFSYRYKVYFVTNGLFHGADTSVGWMFYNQSAAVLGNAIGGAIIIGTFEHAMNHWESPLPWEKGHATGTLAAHDVESSRKANEYRPPAELQQMKDLTITRTRTVSQTVPRSPNVMTMAERIGSV